MWEDMPCVWGVFGEMRHGPMKVVAGPRGECERCFCGRADPPRRPDKAVLCFSRLKRRSWWGFGSRVFGVSGMVCRDDIKIINKKIGTAGEQ